MGETRSKTICGALAASILCSLLVANPAQGQTRGRVVILVDFSLTMDFYVPGTSHKRRDEAQAWVLQVVRVSLKSGKAVNIIPFAHAVLDKELGKELSIDSEDALEEAVRSAKDYLEGYDCQATSTAIWHSINTLIPELEKLPPTTQLWVCTDGDDNASEVLHGIGQADVEKKLAKWLRSSAQSRSAVQMWKWKSGLLPVAADIRLLETSASLNYSEIDGKIARIVIPVEANFSTTAQPADVISEPSVVVQAVGPAPDLEVLRCSMAPLKKGNDRGEVTLDLRGRFPSVEKACKYTILLEFLFDNRSNEERRSINPAELFVLTVTGSPQPDLTVRDRRKIKCFPGEHVDVPFTVGGNRDAAGMTCTLTVTAPKGVTGQIVETGEDGVEQVHSDELKTLLPESGVRKFVCRVRASGSCKDVTVKLTANVRGALDDEKLTITAEPAQLEPVLVNANRSTRLDYEQLPSSWQELKAGPIRVNASHQNRLGDVVLLFEADDSKSDAELAFDSNGGTRIEERLRDAQRIRLWGRWKSDSPPPHPVPPAVRISLAESEIKRDYAIGIATHRLQVPVDVGSPKVQVSPTDVPGIADVEIGDTAERLLPELETQPNSTVEQGYRVKWNPAASATAVRVQCEFAGPVKTCRLEVRGEGLERIRQDEYELKGIQDPNRDGSIREAHLHLIAESAHDIGEGEIRITFEVVDDAPKGVRNTVFVTPIRVRPAVVEVIGTGSDNVPLFLGSPFSLMDLELKNGRIPVKVAFSVECDDPDITVPTVLSDGRRDSLHLESKEIRHVNIQGIGKGSASNAGAVGRGTLVIKVHGENTNVILRHGDDEGAVIGIPFRYRVDSWSFAAFFRGRLQESLPKNGKVSFPHDKHPVVIGTQENPIQLRLDEPYPLSDEHRDALVTVSPTTDEEFLGDVKFVVATDEVTKRRSALPMSELDRVIGFELTLRDDVVMPNANSVPFDSRIVIRSVEPLIELELPIRGSLAPLNWMAWVLASTAAIVLLAVAVLKVRSRQPSAAAFSSEASGPNPKSVFDANGDDGSRGIRSLSTEPIHGVRESEPESPTVRSLLDSTVEFDADEDESDRK